MKGKHCKHLSIHHLLHIGMNYSPWVLNTLPFPPCCCYFLSVLSWFLDLGDPSHAEVKEAKLICLKPARTRPRACSRHKKPYLIHSPTYNDIQVRNRPYFRYNSFLNKRLNLVISLDRTLRQIDIKMIKIDISQFGTFGYKSISQICSESTQSAFTYIHGESRNREIKERRSSKYVIVVEACV